MERFNESAAREWLTVLLPAIGQITKGFNSSNLHGFDVTVRTGSATDSDYLKWAVLLARLPVSLSDKERPSYWLRLKGFRSEIVYPITDGELAVINTLAAQIFGLDEQLENTRPYLIFSGAGEQNPLAVTLTLAPNRQMFMQRIT